LNPALVRLDGLAELEASDSISVAGNESLVELLLPSLGNVGTLSITGHASLASVGLPVLSSAGNLTVADNLVLTTLGTLDALTEVDSLIIAGNPMLPQCFVDELDERLMACSSTCGGNDTTALCE
jgi:hypothetical protein